MLHKKVCVNGEKSTYNQHAQIIINSPEQIIVFKGDVMKHKLILALAILGISFHATR